MLSDLDTIGNTGHDWRHFDAETQGTRASGISLTSNFTSSTPYHLVYTFDHIIKGILPTLT